MIKIASRSMSQDSKCPKCQSADIRRDLVIGDNEAIGFWVCEKCKHQWDKIDYPISLIAARLDLAVRRVRR